MGRSSRRLSAAAGIILDASFVLNTTKPNSTNTGHDAALVNGTVAGTLTNGRSVFTASTANATYSNKRFECFVVVTASGVTFDNCEIAGPQSFSTAAYPGFAGLIDVRAGNTTFSRCTVHADYPGYWMNGINVTASGGAELYRCNLYNTGDLMASKGNLKVRGCYVHDFTFHDGATTTNGNGSEHETDGRFPGWTHNDGAQIYGGTFLAEGTYWESYASHGASGHPAATGTFATLPVGYSPASGTVGGVAYSNGGRTFPDYNWGHCIFIGPYTSRTNSTVRYCWFEGGEIHLQQATQGQGFDDGNVLYFHHNRFGNDIRASYVGNPTTPDDYQFIEVIKATVGNGGSLTYDNNIFDTVGSVPSALRGQPIDPYLKDQTTRWQWANTR